MKHSALDILLLLAPAIVGNCQQPDFLDADVAVNLSIPSGLPDLLERSNPSREFVPLGESFFDDCITHEEFEALAITEWWRFESLKCLYELQPGGLTAKPVPSAPARSRILVARWFGTLDEPESPQVKLELTEIMTPTVQIDRPEGQFIDLIWEGSRFELRFYEKTTLSYCRYVRQETKLVNVIAMIHVSSSQAMVLQAMDRSMAVPRIRICADGTAEILDMASNLRPLEAILVAADRAFAGKELHHQIPGDARELKPMGMRRSGGAASVALEAPDWEPSITWTDGLSEMMEIEYKINQRE